MSHDDWQGTTNQPLGLQQQMPVSILFPFSNVTIVLREADGESSFQGIQIKHSL